MVIVEAIWTLDEGVAGRVAVVAASTQKTVHRTHSGGQRYRVVVADMVIVVVLRAQRTLRIAVQQLYWLRGLLLVGGW